MKKITLRLSRAECNILKERISLLEEDYRKNNKKEKYELANDFLDFLEDSSKIQFLVSRSSNNIKIESSNLFFNKSSMQINSSTRKNFIEILKDVKKDLSEVESESNFLNKSKFIDKLIKNLSR